MKLFIPGPVSIDKITEKALQTELIGHRSDDFRQLMQECSIGLQKVFQTKNPVLISTSSGTGLMEAAIRNCVKKNVLVCACGAFGEKCGIIAENCGKNVTYLKAEYGKSIKAKDLASELSSKNYEAVCITHNETSTGVQNFLKELGAIVKEAGLLLLVDTVSSMGGVNIPVDELHIDVCVTSSQKCFALPPGLSFASVSKLAIEKAKQINDKGYYFNFVELIKAWEKNEIPYTPAVGLIFGLNAKLKQIEEEGLQKRFERHKALAERTRKWAVDNGFELFAEEHYRSKTITCIENTKKIDFKKVKKKMLENGYLIDTGYRKLNEKLLMEGKNDTFRIPHMGELTMEELEQFLKTMENSIKKTSE